MKVIIVRIQRILVHGWLIPAGVLMHLGMLLLLEMLIHLGVLIRGACRSHGSCYVPRDWLIRNLPLIENHHNLAGQLMTRRSLSVPESQRTFQPESLSLHIELSICPLGGAPRGPDKHLQLTFDLRK